MGICRPSGFNALIGGNQLAWHWSGRKKIVCEKRFSRNHFHDAMSFAESAPEGLQLCIRDA